MFNHKIRTEPEDFLKNDFLQEKGDIRLILKMPSRGSLDNRKVACVFKAVKQALRSSSGGRKKQGFSTRQRGAGVTSKAQLGRTNNREFLPSIVRPLQRVSVRWTYAKNKSDGLWSAHGKYIERESAQGRALDKSLDQETFGVHGFGHDGDTMPISETLNIWQKKGDKHLFKLIISPEFGHQMDLKQHTKEFVQQMEKDLRTKLQWVAVSHFNTDNPHVHLSIRGLDDRDLSLEISPAYIKEGSRLRAQEAATRQLGYRSERDIAESLERQIIQQRFTDIDRSLIKKATNGELSFHNIQPISERAREIRIRQIRRLSQLETMGLAVRCINMTWRLNPSLETALRQMQISQDRLKTKFQHRELISDPSAPLIATVLKTPGERVAGKLVGTGLNEQTGRAYLLIEGFDGKVHYLNQTAKMERKRGNGELKIGNYVTLEVTLGKKQVEEKKNVIIKINQFGRTLVPELLDAELFKMGKTISPIASKETVSGAFFHAATARLQKLELAGAVEIIDGTVRLKSNIAYDRVRFADASLHTLNFTNGVLKASVIAKGLNSIVVQETADKPLILLTATQLQAMGINQKYLAKDASISINLDPNGKLIAKIFRERDTFPKNENDWQVDTHINAEKALMEALTKKHNKDFNRLNCAHGCQVSGQIVWVQRNIKDTTVIIDSGRELTLLQQPISLKVDLKVGQRIRATVEVVKDKNSGHQIMQWRFAILERAQAHSKDKQRRLF